MKLAKILWADMKREPSFYGVLYVANALLAVAFVCLVFNLVPAL